MSDVTNGAWLAQSRWYSGLHQIRIPVHIYSTRKTLIQSTFIQLWSGYSRSNPKPDDEKSDIFRRFVVKLLWVMKRARPDIEPTVGFLSTRVRVQLPDKDDWHKVKRLMCWIKQTDRISTPGSIPFQCIICFREVLGVNNFEIVLLPTFEPVCVWHETTRTRYVGCRSDQSTQKA